VNQALWESIPTTHRPSLSGFQAGTAVEYLGTTHLAIGSTILPVILKDGDTGQPFRVKLFALVVPDLRMGMYIACSAPFYFYYTSSKYDDGTEDAFHLFSFGIPMGPNGNSTKVSALAA